MIIVVFPDDRVTIATPASKINLPTQQQVFCLFGVISPEPFLFIQSTTMKRNVLKGLLCLSVFIPAFATAQDFKLSGKIHETSRDRPIAGVTCILTNMRDTIDKRMTSTDASGTFQFNGLKRQTYRFLAKRIGYVDIVQTVDMTSNFQLIGPFSMDRKVEQLKDVVIKADGPAAVQKGDTTEMSADAYKVNPDATAHDLVQKMPGITVDNDGTIKAHGENVQKVLIDGKTYFGEDPSMALQNLPAEVIDKVQIYNKMSDQAEFTGFDDGNSAKVINIITKVDKRNGKNGTFSVGHDNKDKYAASGRLNISEGAQRLTLTGGANNVNQQNFSSQDMLGAMSSSGSGGGRGGRSGGGGRGSASGGFAGANRGAMGGTLVGRQGGMNTTKAIGINYTNQLSKKVEITGSYFFNTQDNLTQQPSLKQTFNSKNGADNKDSSLYNNSSSNSHSNNYNHRFDMRLQYDIDSANSVIWSPKFSIQQNNRNSSSNQENYYLENPPILKSNSASQTDGLGYTYASDVVVRHKFVKKGRTVSADLSVSGNLNNSDGTNQSSTLTYDSLGNELTSARDLRLDSKSNGIAYSANLAYTEPVGTNGIVQIGYNVSLNKDSAHRYSYNELAVPDTIETKLSNVYKNEYETQRFGGSYRIRGGEKLVGSVGVDYQFADLTGRRVYPGKADVDKKFKNILPNAFLNYKFSQKANLRVQYRTSTSPPSISQLQDVWDVSNPTSFTKGNPDLKHQYGHSGSLNYRFSNPEKSITYSINLAGGLTMNHIGNYTVIVTKPTVIQPGDTLPKSGQYSYPRNIDTAAWNTRLFVNYGFSIAPINCKIQLLGGGTYSNTPGYVNGEASITQSYSFTGGTVIGSNISENVDFTLSYTGSYTIAKSSTTSSLNSNSWYHSISLRSNFIIWKGIVFQNSLVEQINRGLAGGYNVDNLQWNMGLGKKFLNNSCDLRMNVYDLLNSNSNITHTVGVNSIQDTRTNILQRYYMLTFTYTLRAYRNNSQKKGDDNNSDRPRRNNRGSGGGGRGGNDFGG